MPRDQHADCPTSAEQSPTPAFVTVQGEQGHIHLMLRKPNPGVGARSKTSGTSIFHHGGPIIYATKVAAIYMVVSHGLQHPPPYAGGAAR